MADNTRGGSQDGSDPLIATDEVTYSGDTADVQLVRVVGVTGSEGSKTVVDVTDSNEGHVIVGGWSQDGADATSNTSGVMLGGDASPGQLEVRPFVYNGSTWDRPRGDITNGLDVDVTRLPALPAGTNNIGDVDIASSVVLTTKQAASTGTLANVASSASSVTLLASNAARLGATIHNDSTQILYVKFGTTASATSYTVKMVADAYYEVPFGYTGRIDGIWASANGNARVTEMT